VGGDTVTINAGGNLTIESLQDTETYRGHSSSSGASISSDVTGTGLLHNTSSSASFSKGSMNSDYASVTNQAGIYAGNGGFQINVADNTHLTGGILDSTASADTNHLTTGTLTMEDIQNKADYDVKNIGVSYTHSGTLEEKKDNYNKNGLIPSLSPGAKNDASSTTHAAIGQGTITTTKEQIDLSQINRDTQHSLNELGKIFDKKKIEEKQELAKLFAKNADELLHDFSKDGSIDKVLAHGLVAEIASQIAGNKAGSGFLAGAANEALINKIDQLANGNPAAAQWISAALGATINAATGGNVNTGAMVAQSGTQWNKYEKIPQVKQKIGDYVDSGAYKKLPDGSYHMIYDPNSNVGVAVDNKGEMIDFVWKEGEKFATISHKVIEENMDDITFKRIDDSGKDGLTGIYSFEEKDGIAAENTDLSSPAKNTVKKVGDIPFDIANYYGANVGSVSKVVGAKLTVLDGGTSLVRDYQKYSGDDFRLAVGIDVGTPIAVKLIYGSTIGKSVYLITKDSKAGLVIGAIAGVTADTGSDKIADQLKKDYLQTDEEKKDQSNVGVAIPPDKER
jgi:hypothetical protein